MSTKDMSMERHPDIAALGRWEELAQNPAAQFTDGAAILAGLYVACSPWIAGFAGTTSLAMTNLIAGLAVAVLAAGFATFFGRTHGMAFVAPLLGVWIMASPWIVDGVTRTDTIMWSNLVAGAVIVVLGLGVTGMGAMRRK